MFPKYHLPVGSSVCSAWDAPEHRCHVGQSEEQRSASRKKGFPPDPVPSMGPPRGTKPGWEWKWGLNTAGSWAGDKLPLLEALCGPQSSASASESTCRIWSSGGAWLGTNTHIMNRARAQIHPCDPARTLHSPTVCPRGAGIPAPPCNPLSHSRAGPVAAACVPPAPLGEPGLRALQAAWGAEKCHAYIGLSLTGGKDQLWAWQRGGMG